jgi:hypothetical protein
MEGVTVETSKVVPSSKQSVSEAGTDSDARLGVDPDGDGGIDAVLAVGQSCSRIQDLGNELVGDRLDGVCMC